MKSRYYLVGALMLAAGGLLAFVLLRPDDRPMAALPAEPATATVSPPSVQPTPALVRGPADAPITLEEFSDYECPYCARSFLAAGAELEAFVERRGDIRYAFYDLAGPTHSHALAASTAARCAGQQGRQPDAQRLLFERQREWAAPDSLRIDAIELVAGLAPDRGAYRRCVADQEHVARILEANLEYALARGVQATPTFLVTTRDTTRRLRGTIDSARIARLLEGPPSRR